jgi:hypothetical protein
MVADSNRSSSLYRTIAHDSLARTIRAHAIGFCLLHIYEIAKAPNAIRF